MADYKPHVGDVVLIAATIDCVGVNGNPGRGIGVIIDGMKNPIVIPREAIVKLERPNFQPGDMVCHRETHSFYTMRATFDDWAWVESVAVGDKRMRSFMLAALERVEQKIEPEKAGPKPRLADNDKGEITVSLDGRELRDWPYASDDERRQQMTRAREYIDGWYEGRKVPT